MARRVSLYTLGCKLNQVETSALGKSLEIDGWQIVPFGEEADLIVLNTCTVTEQAETECRKLVRRGKRTSPNAAVAVTGCYAQLRPQQIADIEGVSAVFGTREKMRIAKVADTLVQNVGDTPFVDVDSMHDDVSFTSATTADTDSRARGFLKLQDGCDYTCSFCTIPAARGPARAMPLADIERHVEELSRSGFEEVVLTGVNMGEYRTSDGFRFIDVVKKLTDLKPPFRLRVSSIEPNTMSDELIETMAASEVFCPHYHIPLQSGSASVLKRMRRRYNPARYRHVVELIHSLQPHAAIGADVITGFPGETDEEFAETKAFVGDLPLTYLHAFTYSSRPGTLAETMSQVSVHVRRRRTAEIRSMSERLRTAFYGRNLGSVREWHPESRHATGGWMGWTDNYIKVVLPRNEELVHARVSVHLGAINHDIVLGTLL